jgi:predicted Abi (CAAX) family protease
MIIPAFGEELVFRGWLTPGLGDSRRSVLWIALSVLMFMTWHVIEALTFLPGAQLFLRPAFLICAGILGLTCALMRYRTGSLWPAVIFHGLLVWLWQALFAGPDVVQLMRP